MTKLFSPLRIREIEFRNRIVVSPMCMYSSQDGFANDWHLVHLGSRAIGGAGLVMTEATAVSPEGRISVADLGIWKDDHIDFLKRITQFILKQGSVPGIQLAHAGRKASRNEPWNGDILVPESQGGWKVVAPSSIPFSPEYGIPEELNKEGIGKVINDFSNAAVRALKAGFKVIEIHAAHGYLINEFMSPLANKRTDDYGGTFENRIRLLLEVTSAVRKVWPAEFPLFVRISSTDWVDGGWTIEESVALAKKLKGIGVDLIDSSSGGIIPGVKIPVEFGYQVPFAERIRLESGIMTGAVGLILTSAQAEEVISKNQADLVILARELLRDPYFPMHAAIALEEDIPWPNQYLRAKRKK
jgi:2,4-dienoyl-CoA reductase-like NADH-dependent reductase (Old Yellow Enzyme family)